MAFNTSLKAKNLAVRKGKVEFIVLHDTAGSGGYNDVVYLANDPEKRGVSVDFVVPKDGVIYQLNHNLKGRYTFHAGRKTAFRGRVNGGVNSHSIGIEIAQKAKMQGQNPHYPTPQVRAVAEVCRFICKEFGLTKLDITTHAKIIRDGSRSDPREFPWELFWSYFNNVIGDSEVDASTHPRISHTVVDGDTLYSLAKHYLTSVEKIKALNDMNTASNVIVPGQVLIVKE